MRIAIVNQQTANFGDDCAAAAVIIALQARFPKSIVDVIYHDTPTDRSARMPDAGLSFGELSGLFLEKSDFAPLALALYGISGAKRFFSDRVLELTKTYRSYDHIFVTPCGANIGVYKDWWFLLKLMAVIVSGKTPIFHLNTIGKSHDFLFDTIAKTVLRRSKIFVREDASYQYLRGMGIACERGVDSAFALPVRPPRERKREVVVVATDLSKWFSKYRQFDMQQFSSQLAVELASFCGENQLTVRLIPHIHSINGEANLLADLAAAIRQQGASVVVDEEFDDYRAYEERIASASLVVSMRYHGVVLAAKNATPFVSLSYENKMEEVSKYCGFGRLSLPMGEWNSDRFQEMLGFAKDHGPDISAGLERRLSFLRDLALLPTNSLWLSQSAQE